MVLMWTAIDWMQAKGFCISSLFKSQEVATHSSFCTEFPFSPHTPWMEKVYGIVFSFSETLFKKHDVGEMIDPFHRTSTSSSWEGVKGFLHAKRASGTELPVPHETFALFSFPVSSLQINDRKQKSLDCFSRCYSSISISGSSEVQAGKFSIRFELTFFGTTNLLVVLSFFSKTLSSFLSVIISFSSQPCIKQKELKAAQMSFFVTCICFRVLLRWYRHHLLLPPLL